MIVLCLLLIGVTPILGTSLASITGVSRNAGIVIGRRYLLFSPSALAPLDNHQVRVGSLNDDSGGLTFDIKSYISHPNYSPISEYGKGRTGKYNKDKIALVITTKDLPIGRNNVDQENLPASDFNPTGPGSVIHWGYSYGEDYYRTSIDIKSKADCEANVPNVDCSKYLWAKANTFKFSEGAPVYSGNTLIGTIAFAEGDNVLINYLPPYVKWIKQTIRDEETFFA